ncbi:MAG: ATP-binding cassette domain-containing protein [Blautia sp.]|jgi:ABC-type multidrug transport system ATPase subunit
MDDINRDTEEVKKIASKLVICDGEQEICQERLERDMTIGSNQAGKADLQLAAEGVAGLHGRFISTEEGFSYQDLEGAGRTYLNDMLAGSEDLPGKGPYPLVDGDVLKIQGPDEAHEAVLLFRQRFDENVEWRSADLETGMHFHISRHEEAGEEEDEVRVNPAELPKRYATLSHEKEGWKVIDHNTKYGVRVNNHLIEGERLLQPLDVIRIGDTVFLFRGEELFYNHKEASKNSLVIHIEERSVWNFFRKKILLEAIDLSIHPGEMVLILGGSGAGKTTFLNAVMGYEKAKGTIKEGDLDIYRNYNQMKYEIGFVPQQDLLRMEDSVEDTLNNAAELRMPKATTEEERKQRVETVLQLFGLERERESLVEKLSGGQRKRLSIAVEYIANPSLFFLDEPDSGLDGVMARALMENLREIADERKIVIVITHSPDRVDDLFDKVMVLAKSAKDDAGHMAFYGTPEEAREFFGTESMEGIVKRVNRTDEGGEGRADEFIDKYQKLSQEE